MTTVTTHRAAGKTGGTSGADPDGPSLRRVLAPVALAIVAVVVAYLIPFGVGPYYQQVAYQIVQFAALATAWNLLAGYVGLVSLGSAAFIGLGSYSVAELGIKTGLPLLVTVLLGAVVAAAFAAAVSPAMFRLKGLYFTIGTLALSEALRILMVNLQTFGGASGLVLQGFAPETYQVYWWALAVAVLATVVVTVLLMSPISLSLRAVRDDEYVARQMGVVSFRVKLGAFMLSAALMGLVGGIQATKLGVIEPYSAFGLSWTVQIVAVAIIGGLGTKAGPWVGAVFVVILGELLQDYPEVHTALNAVVLILVIRFAPLGVWGTILSWRQRRVAREH